MYMLNVLYFDVSDPDLIFEKCLEGSDGFEGMIDMFPPGHNLRTVKPELSGIALHTISGI